MDTFLHIILGAIVTAIVAFVISTTGKRSFIMALPISSVFAGFLLYVREVAQHQTKYLDSFFFSGWCPWSGGYPWSLGKQIETFVPSLIIVVSGFVIS